jgi:hypothetical protein
MATALTSGYIYFIESDAGDNQNWLHDPENIDLDNFTEGTDYCKIEIPEQLRVRFGTGIEVTDSGGGTSYDFRSNRKGYVPVLRGLVTSRANLRYIDSFIMMDRHTSGSSATFVRIYMIIKFAANDYFPFVDADDTQREYCRGVIPKAGGEYVWTASSPHTITINLNWRSVWG